MEQPVIVCLVSTNLQALPMKSWGGLEGQVELEGLGLAALGHEVHIVTAGRNQQPEVYNQGGVTYHSVSKAAEYDRNASIFELIAGLFRFTARMLAICRDTGPDVVHIHARYPFFFGLFLGARSRKNWRLIYHAHNWKRAERMPYARFSARRAAAVVGAIVDNINARFAHHVVTTSVFMRDQIIGSTGTDPEKVSIVANVIDLTEFKRRPVQRHSHEILFVGRIAEEKGLLTLIEAVGLVAKSGHPIHLNVVGGDKGGSERGSYAQSCTDLVRSLELGSRVTFLGEVPNRQLPEHLSRARALVVPSIWNEPFGVVVLEGLACGTAVIAGRVGGMPELLEEGKTGLLVPPGDVHALAEALRRVLEDDELVRTAGIAGPELVSRKYSSDVIGRTVEDLYRDIGVLR